MSVVHTAAGAVEGVRRGPVTAWLGVPFAAPPTGARRFRPPAPVTPWAGVRRAARVGAAATQQAVVSAARSGLGSGLSEDCLFLNVWSPAADAAGRPVLVWIHGGAYTSGSGALYDGAGLAPLGDIVVVTVNYRLGVFGFVDIGAVCTDPVEGNLGLRDQIAALQWVRDNIAAFGGDPTRVTVAGESAGSVSLSLLLSAPSAAGLFRAAIMQSGSYTLIHGDQIRDVVAQRYADDLGLAAAGLSDWQRVPAERLLAAQTAVDKALPGTVAAAPWFDGDLVPGSLAAARRATPPDVTLLAGHNHDEITLFQLLPGDILPTTRAAVAARLREDLGAGHAARLLEQYPDNRLGNRALTTDFTFAMPTRHFAERHVAAGRRAYFYRFDSGLPFVGATHAAELPYLWDWRGLQGFALRGPNTPARRALARRLRRHWVSFVANGAPEPGWEAFELPDRATMVFDPGGDRMQPDPDGVRRATWAGRDVLARP